jgi:hypothetical protein
MSTNLLRIIPTDPAWTPNERAAGDALAALRDLAPGASATEAVRHDDVTFVDQGANFEAVRCPACGAELDVDWWQEAMEAAHRVRFADLAVVVPCCGVPASLNELDYDWPAGFARFVLEARDPGRQGPTDEELARVTAALGHPVRVIWAHY